MGCTTRNGKCVGLNDHCSLFGYSVCHRPELCDDNEREVMRKGGSTNAHERQIRMGRSMSQRSVRWLKYMFHFHLHLTRSERQLTCSMNLKVSIDDTTQLLGEHRAAGSWMVLRGSAGFPQPRFYLLISLDVRTGSGFYA